MDNKYTVGQIAQKFGITARTVRHYEKVGLLDSGRDTVSNYRLYGHDEENRLNQIMLLKSMSFTLKEISSIITSNGNKNTIIQIIGSRMKSLSKKSLLYSQCVELLNEFLITCSRQEHENINSFRILEEILALKSQNQTAAVREPEEVYKEKALEKDEDLEILGRCLSEDFNPLYLPFVVGQEDGYLLENYFVNHRRFWGLRNINLSDGTNLEQLYHPSSFKKTIAHKIYRTVYDSEIYRSHFSYRDIVLGLCSILMGVDYDIEDPLPVLEAKLVWAVFARALEMFEMAVKLDEANIRAIADALDIRGNIITRQELTEHAYEAVQSGGIQAFRLSCLVNNAIKRCIFAGPFYVLTEAAAFSSRNWELDRALDMAVGALWQHEVIPAGQPYQTLVPVIYHIAYMRMRTRYASQAYIQPELVDLGELRIIGIELVTTDRDGEGFAKIPPFEEEYIAGRVEERIPNRVMPGLRYGLNARYNGEYYSFISGEEVSSLENIPDGMTGELVPGGTYAVFTVSGGPLPYKVIETIIYIYEHWLPVSGYRRANRPGFNLYVNASGRSDSVIKIYIPVDEKEVQ